MASTEQIKSNRLNALKSTGPRTAGGKARSRRNALTHGLTAKNIVIGDEDSKEFEALRAALEDELEAKTSLERELVERITGLLWRLRRVPRAEARLVRALYKEAHYGESHHVSYDEVDQWETTAFHLEEARRRCDEDLQAETGLSRNEVRSLDGYEERWKASLAEVVKEIPRVHPARVVEEMEQHKKVIEPDLGLLVTHSASHDALSKLDRHETSLTNQLTRAIGLLRVIQAQRAAVGEKRAVNVVALPSRSPLSE